MRISHYDFGCCLFQYFQQSYKLSNVWDENSILISVNFYYMHLILYLFIKYIECLVLDTVCSKTVHALQTT